MKESQAKSAPTCVISKRASGKARMQERILEITDRLFYRQGIRAIGVDTIAAEVGISKRTLYNHFPSKDELIVAYLTRRFRPISVSDAPPAEQVLAVFDRLERNCASEGFRGCPFVNAVAELGEPTHAARDIAVAFKEERRIWFREMLTRLGAGDPDGLATQLSLLVDGAIATALVRGDPAMTRAAREAACTLLRAGGARLALSSEKALRRRTKRSTRQRRAVDQS